MLGSKKMQYKINVILLSPRHAGYSYSGQAAAYGYKALQNYLQSASGACVYATMPTLTLILDFFVFDTLSALRPPRRKRCFLLGPSHHWYLKTCALSIAKVYATPVGNLTIDEQSTHPLLRTPHADAPPPKRGPSRRAPACSLR